MTNAVVEHDDGSRTHHSNVRRGALRMMGPIHYVVLIFIDGSKKEIFDGVGVQLVDELWFAEKQLGLN